MTARLLVLVMLLTPALGDALACSAARACAQAPCCVTKSGTCPMHESKPSSNCRMTTCSHDGVAIAQAPPAAHRATLIVARHDHLALATFRPEVAFAAYVAAPPDPPPPRDRFSSIA